MGYSVKSYAKKYVDDKKSSGQSLKKGDIGNVIAKEHKSADRGSDFGAGWKGAGKSAGMDKSKQREAAKKSDRLKKQESKATNDVLERMKEPDAEYLRSSKQNIKDYQAARKPSIAEYMSRLGEVEAQSEAQGKDAQQTYSNDIQPRMKGIMEDAQKQSEQAMSLEEAGDPNNKIQQAVRSLYDKQAQGVRKQGLADTGILTALGSQATAGQMGAGPTTGAQLQLLNAGNQQQAGQAYARAQQQMQSLREQGLNRGFQESDSQYRRGESARDRYGASVAGYEGAMDRNIGRQAGFRGERLGYGADRMGIQQGVNREDLGMTQGYDSMVHGVNQGQNMRQLQANSANFAGQQQAIQNQISQANADNAARSSMVTGVMGAGGAVAGGYFGGPAGAAAGGAAGNAAGNNMARQGQGAQTSYQSTYNSSQNPYAQTGQNPYAQQNPYGSYA